MLTQDDIIYFIVTDRFANGDHENDFDLQPDNPEGFHGGDFQGILDRIPYLQALGITALWITPVFENIHQAGPTSYSYHGYWPLNFEKVDGHLYSPKPGIEAGSKRYLKELVDQLHSAGIKVILDMVVNHTGYNHPGLRGEDPIIKPHWFNQDKSVDEMGDIASWVSGLPDLKQDDPEVADYFVRMIADWIQETGVDCIRMDTAKNVEGIFWQYYKTTVKGPYPEVTLLGEVLEFNIDSISHYQQHFAFDSLFDFPLQKGIVDVFIEGKSFTEIAAPYSSLLEPGNGILDRDTSYTNHNRLVTLLDNHDLPQRFLSWALNKSNGNRGWAETTLELAMTLLLTSRGIPQIYYGTELGLEGDGDHDNRRDMPWQLLANGLSPAEDSPAHTMFQLTKRLIGIRKSSAALRYGTQITLHVDDRCYVYLREYRDEWIIVAINLADEDMTEALYIPFGENANLPPRLKEQMASQQYVDLNRQVESGRFENQILNLKLNKRCASILMPLRQMLVSVN